MLEVSKINLGINLFISFKHESGSLIAIKITMSTIQTYKDILSWERSVELAKMIYKSSGSGPFARDKVLQHQIRKAVLSVSSNIAEGFEREGNNEFIHFLTIAKGSTAEVQTQVRIAFEVGYIMEEEFNDLDIRCTEVIGLIAGFLKYLRTSGFEGHKFKRK